MSEPVYRTLSTRDLDPVADLEREVLDSPWSRASLESFLVGSTAGSQGKSPGGFSGGSPVGGLATGVWSDGILVGAVLAAWTGDRVDLYRLAVRGPFRRRGLARALVGRVLDSARELRARGVDLEFRADNTAARAFYADLGFDEVGRRVGYYRGDGGAVDAVLMSLELGDSPREPGVTSG